MYYMWRNEKSVVSGSGRIRKRKGHNSSGGPHFVAWPAFPSLKVRTCPVRLGLAHLFDTRCAAVARSVVAVFEHPGPIEEVGLIREYILLCVSKGQTKNCILQRHIQGGTVHAVFTRRWVCCWENPRTTTVQNTLAVDASNGSDAQAKIRAGAPKVILSYSR